MIVNNAHVLAYPVGTRTFADRVEAITRHLRRAGVATVLVTDGGAHDAGGETISCPDNAVPVHLAAAGRLITVDGMLPDFESHEERERTEHENTAAVVDAVQVLIEPERRMTMEARQTAVLNELTCGNVGAIVEWTTKAIGANAL